MEIMMVCLPAILLFIFWQVRRWTNLAYCRYYGGSNAGDEIFEDAGGRFFLREN
jgi:hypothetical protein